REIAAEAGVSEGTLYNYFPNKRAILLALIDHINASWLRDIECIQSDTPEEAIAEFIARRMHFAREHPTTILTLQQALLDPEVGSHLEQAVRQGQGRLIERLHDLAASGVLRPVDPFVAEEALASMITGLAIGMELAAAGHHPPPLPLEELADQLADVLMNGLKVQPSTDQRKETQP
ncbi:MAG: TetR/AcrR family transcriptional regulator, partial [Anaerolineae bacterium]|nr:TetR/AcrR family transcriptional regulator [Anaerolineae bacterium]